MNMQNKNGNSKLDSVWKYASRYFPVCYVVYKGTDVDLNAENRVQFVLSQVCFITTIQLPPVKGNVQCTREKIAKSFFSINWQ